MQATLPTAGPDPARAAHGRPGPRAVATAGGAAPRGTSSPDTGRLRRRHGHPRAAAEPGPRHAAGLPGAGPHGPGRLPHAGAQQLRHLPGPPPGLPRLRLPRVRRCGHGGRHRQLLAHQCPGCAPGASRMAATTRKPPTRPPTKPLRRQPGSCRRRPRPSPAAVPRRPDELALLALKVHPVLLRADLPTLADSAIAAAVITSSRDFDGRAPTPTHGSEARSVCHPPPVSA